MSSPPADSSIDINPPIDTTDRPDDTPFKQQRLDAWQPILTPYWVIASFLIITIIFIPIGSAIVSASSSVIELKARYDTCTTTYCNVNITVPSDMAAPIYFYYQLVNFYQNHRRYVKSRADLQLRGDLTADTSTCDPLATNTNNSISKTIYPCGLIANSFFNDVFNASRCVNNNCEMLAGSNWQKQGIAWSSDVQYKFIKPTTTIDSANFYTDNTNNLPLPDVTDEEFIVWMRTAGLPTFKKLNRRILSSGFSAGDVISVQIYNNFPVAQFGGEKWVVFSTTSWLGGKNDFLGWAYIAVGIVCFILAVGFGILQYINPRKLGDMSYFHWNGVQDK